MTDIKRAEQALRNAHNAGDVESARAIAQYIKRNREQAPAERPPLEQPKSERSGLSEFGAQSARGIAGFFGAPIDLMSSGLGAIHPSLQSEEPIGGSQSLERLMRATGTDVATEAPTTFAGRAGRIAGEATSFAIPLTAGMQAVGRGTSTLAPAARRGLESMVSRPKTFAALEALGVGGAAAGGQFAQRGGAGELGQTAGEVAGGVIAPTVAMGGLAGRTARFIGDKARGLKGSERRAADRLQQLVPDADIARQRLADETLADLTPAQRIGSPELLAVERAAATKTAAGREASDIRDAQNLQRLRQEIEPVVPSGATREFLEARVDRINNKLTQRTQDAVREAETKISRLTPEMRRSESSRIMADEIEKVYTSARGTERGLWESIPTATIPTGKLKKDFQEIVFQTPKAQRDQIPQKAYDMLGKGGKFKGIENIKELQGLRSALLEEARIARAGGNYNKARLSDSIADSVLEEMGAGAGASTPVGAALREALDYSRYINQTFRQGVIGRVLGTDATGAPRIAPELVSQAIIGSGAERGVAGVNRAISAAPTDQMNEAVKQTLLDSLEKVAQRGEFNPAAAERWLRQNRDILDQHPNVAQNVREAIKAQNKAAGASLRERTIGTNLSKAQKSTTAQYLNADIGQEFDKVFKSQDPAKSVRDLKRLVRGNPDAVDGLRSGAMEHLFRRSGTGKLDNLGVEIVSGDKLMLNINNPKIKPALQELLGKDQFRSLEKVAMEMAQIQRAQATKPATRIMDDIYSSILSVPARVAGAQVGRTVAGVTGGGTVQTPGIFSANAKKLLDRMTRDKGEELLIQALNDKNLMEALLQNVTTPQGARVANRKFNLWLSSPAGRMFLMEEEE
jgi:hypothetical protein